MPNYRGGDIAQSPYAAELIKAIKAGQTERQYKRDLITRALLSVTQAGLMGGGGVVSALSSQARQDKADAGSKAKSDEQYANSPTKDYVSNPNIADKGDVPAWLGAGGVGHDSGLQRSDEFYDDPGNDGSTGTVNPDGSVNVKSAAKQALALQGVNASARDAQIGGTYTSSGLDNAYKQSSMHARDIDTGMNGINQGDGTMGGMMNSIPRKTWQQ